MKQELLKAIITDLHLAGIHDIPSEGFMDQEKIESQELIQAIFNQSANTEINAILDNEAFDEGGIAAEMSELFAAFGSGQRPDLGSIETIQATAPKPKKVVKVEKTIIDPRNKPKAVTPTEFNPKKAAIKKAIEEFKPKNYISSKVNDDAKMLLILPYKNEQVLKSKADFTLLENILKAAKLNYSEISIIFIDESFKKVTQGDKKAEQLLAQELENELKLIKQEIILCFGQDCLDLASSEETTIRQANQKVISVANDKKLLANYSLSAMVNTPKYKSTTWNNILLVNKI